MKLSELKTGERGIIVKVQGHGSFRKRIMEMGFVKGKQVEVLLNAPLHDPVKYRVMGYEISLRRQEAEKIEVVSERSHSTDLPESGTGGSLNTPEGAAGLSGSTSPSTLHHEALRQRRTINVALIGNPNCGKTSLFNYASGAHGRVGNYSGVTVDASEAHATMFGYEFNLIDLPGTYSLSCYSPEELYVRNYLTGQMPDVVVNVLDSTNLERNLYLTTQLVDMDLRMVGAFNMYDEFERRGDSVRLDTLSMLFGMPIVPTSFKSGMGVKELFRAVIQVYEGASKPARHFHINYGHEIEAGIAELQKYLKPDEHIRLHYSTRYLAIKLMENDTEAVSYVGRHFSDEQRPADRKKLLAARDRASARILEETGDDAETAIMDAKYGFVNGALTEAGYVTGNKSDTYRTTHIIDRVLSSRYLGFPVFFLLLYIMFETTFSLGQYPMDWIEAAVEWLGDWVGSHMPGGPLRSLLVDGVIAGVGAVIVFLPQILILYFFISMMEDSGYMARAAFIMDKLMHKMGLHGKSFIPLIMGFGCNVPAVMATRTIESRRSRLITMMILPFMSCSARLPIYIMITGAFFLPQHRSWVMLSLYVLGIAMSVLMSKVFSSLVAKGADTPFVMELPPYRWPTAKAIWRHTWEKGREYLKKMGGVILVASVIVWALGYFPHDDRLSPQAQQEYSYIGRLGKTVEPLFLPQGFNWKLDVSLIAGVGAKEIVASSIGVLYGASTESSDDDDALNADSSEETRESLQQLMAADGITPLVAYCYLLFILLYFPCIATIAAIRHETNSWRWAAFAAAYTTSVAWLVSALVSQLGRIFL
jgi:ferrous iron transport protein B